MSSEDFAIASSIISLFIAVTATISNYKLLSLNIQYLDLYIKANETLNQLRNDLNTSIIEEALKDVEDKDK
jgi:hypothetical protein